MCLNWFRNRHLQMKIVPVLFLLSVISINEVSIAQQNQPAAPSAQHGEQDLHQPIRVRIFTLRNITAQQAKDYLAIAQIAGTVLAIPGTTAVSITGNPEQLIQASTVLKLVDSAEKFDVQSLDIAADKTLPAAEKIETQLGREYSVGTLLEGPASGAAIKAIVCPHKDKMLIIAPEGQTNKIEEAVRNALLSDQHQEVQSRQDAQQTPEPQTGTQTQTAVASANDVVFVEQPIVIEPNVSRMPAPAEIASQPNKPATEDDMLGEFLNELTETAKAEKGAEKIKAEPNQPPQPAGQTEQTQVVTERPGIQKQPKEEKPEQTADKIQPSTESQPPIAETEQPPKGQVEEKLPVEANESVQQQLEQKTAEETNESAVQPAIEKKPPVASSVKIPNGDEVLELNLPEKLEIVALIDLVGKYLNLNYLYDETKVAGSVTIKVQGKLRVRELYDLLESVLKFRGFVMSRKGNLVTIAPAAEVLDQDPTFVEGIKPGDVVVIRVFHLQYISTTAAKNLLLQMKLGPNITEIPETGTLVITEYAFRMQRIEDLLALVDVPGPPKEFKLRVLKYTLAESLVPKIQALAEQLGTVNITVGIPTAAAPTTPGVPPRAVRIRQPVPPQSPEAAKKTGVYLDFDKRTNRVLMIGIADEITAVEQIIDSLDVPQQDLRIIREYEIQYVDIDKVVTAIKEFGIIESVVGGATTPSPRGPAAPAPGAQMVEAAGTGLASLDQPQIVMLESTNSLLVNATPEQHIQISQIISYIDREPLQAAIPYRIYRLENQEPEALAEVLNNLIEKTIKDKEGKIQQTVKIQEDIVVVPDKSTFSLIVYASKKNQEWIGNLIKSLDKRRPQVLIDVSLVEITRDDKFQVDIDVIANATDIVSNNIGVTRSILTGGSFPATSPSKKLFEGGYFAGTGTEKNVKGFFSEGRIQALFDLIDKKGYGRILARPKILVNDNELGKIERTETEYVAQTTTTALPGQTQTDTVQTSTSYTPYQAKISLEITPQISEGELLRLEIKMMREDFDDTTGTGGTPKDTTTTNIDTIVTVPDGSTIILGGLTKLNQTKTSNKVPLLGDIPIAGTLFRSMGNVDKGNKLYVFVKANILRPEQTLGLNQLKNISQTNRAEFEKAESEFQQHQDFPGLKPTPMEPERVLEPVENEKPEKPEVLTKK